MNCFTAACRKIGHVLTVCEYDKWNCAFYAESRGNMAANVDTSSISSSLYISIKNVFHFHRVSEIHANSISISNK